MSIKWVDITNGKTNQKKFLLYISKNNDDAPPFNFQGMLRKTQHHRASMKRNSTEDGGSPINGNIVFSSSSMRQNFDFDENDNLPPPVAPRLKPKAPPVPSERKLSFGECTLLGGDDALHNIGTYIQEEIHPGVMLEGYAVEL